MSKMRIYELAKQLGIANKELMEKLREMGVEAKNHMNMVGEEDIEKIQAMYQQKEQKQPEAVQQQAKPEQQKTEAPANKNNAPNQGKQQAKQENRKQENKNGQNRSNQANHQNNNGDKGQNRQNQQNQQNGGKKGKKDKKDQKPKENPIERRRREMEEAKQAEAQAANADDPVIKSIPESITVKDLAEVLGKKGSDLVMAFMKKGQMVNINATLDFDTAASIAEDYNVILELEEEKDILETVFAEEEDSEDDLQERPPVVVVMGHVDHGKTSLLDAIRHSNVTKGEAGGITQHIGAYTVQIDGKPITFLDTPGHEAFTAMRMRGAQITDIAVLVVAADDGVMPQTVEAINHAKAAGVEIIVAINKMDKPTANPDRVMEQLTQHELVPEQWGGDVICVPVSAKTGMGIEDLLENINLVAEVKELKANPDRRAKGAVIEARLDKGQGPVATILVQKGTLRKGDCVIAGTTVGRVRTMKNDKGIFLEEAGPSTPVEITGLTDVPSAGDLFDAVADEKLARELADRRATEEKERLFNSYKKVTLDNLFSQIAEGERKQLDIIVKADVQGSAEAVKQSLEKISNDEVRVKVIHAGVGAINKSDVMLANAGGAIIIGFNVRPDPIAKEEAAQCEVEMRMYRVIYDAINDVTDAMKGMLAPKIREVEQGRLEVRQVYKISSVGLVAGSYVLEGKITRHSKIRVVRDGIVITEDEISSLRRFKDDVKEVAQGYECGVTLEKFADIKEGDIFEAYILEEYRD